MANGADGRRIGFHLVPEFPIYALIPAMEALRIANQNAGRNAFSWFLESADGAPVPAANGMTLAPDRAIDGRPPEVSVSTLIVCAGNQTGHCSDRRLLNRLRRLDRHGVRLGALDTGTFALAAAGLMEGHRMTLHWEAIPLFRERFPGLDVVERIVVPDRNRITCAGGLAAVEMMLHLIAVEASPELAVVVANGLVHGPIRGAGEPQRNVLESAAGVLDPLIVKAMHLMEANLEVPLSRGGLAAAVGLPQRRLQRLFQRRLGDSPMRYYLKVRLQAARNHLFYSDLPIQDIALACGFSGPEVFSRSFRARFGQSPREFRKSYGTDRLHRFHPEFVLRPG